MENRFFYPAIFHKAEEGGFWVSFPDKENIEYSGVVK